MNQTFSLSRFTRLLRTYFVENRMVLLANVALLTVFLIAGCWVAYRQLPSEAAHGRYIVLFFVGGGAWYLFTVQQVAVLNEKERAISYLLRPASRLEKWGQFVVVSGLTFLVVYLLVFTLIDTVGVWFINHRTWEPDELKRIREDYNNQLTIEPFYKPSQFRDIPSIFWFDAALLHPLALALCLFIRRYALPLVPVITFIALVLVFLANHQFLGSIIGSGQQLSTSPFDGMYVVRGENNWRQVRVPQPIGDVIRYGVGASAVVLLYITAFFRLKEREV